MVLMSVSILSDSVLLVDADDAVAQITRMMLRSTRVTALQSSGSSHSPLRSVLPSPPANISSPMLVRSNNLHALYIAADDVHSPGSLVRARAKLGWRRLPPRGPKGRLVHRLL